jgi:hypothetical protein
MRRSFGSVPRLVLSTSALLLVLGLAAPGAAVPVTVFSDNLPTCDPLSVPTEVDELGIPGPFPPDEIIDAFEIPGAPPACPSTYAGSTNFIVIMTNLTPFDFEEVWYVADLETRISNADGLINDGEAFRIDAVGINTPLVFESIAPDGVFEAGETWEFVIQDYSNIFGLPPSAFDSPGAVGFASHGPPSSGSIIAIRVPEPTTALLVASGLIGLSVRSRQH